jgi:hypothetical protein
VVGDIIQQFIAAKAPTASKTYRRTVAIALSSFATRTKVSM